jgi:hypothetical protein
VIQPTGVYLVADVQRILKLRPSTIRREHREHGLRISRRAGRHYVLGEWLLEWLRGGELPRRSETAP